MMPRYWNIIILGTPNPFKYLIPISYGLLAKLDLCERVACLIIETEDDEAYTRYVKINLGEDIEIYTRANI